MNGLTTSVSQFLFNQPRSLDLIWLVLGFKRRTFRDNWNYFLQADFPSCAETNSLRKLRTLTPAEEKSPTAVHILPRSSS